MRMAQLNEQVHRGVQLADTVGRTNLTSSVSLSFVPTCVVSCPTVPEAGSLVNTHFSFASEMLVAKFCSTQSFLWEAQLLLHTMHNFASSHFVSKIRVLASAVCLLTVIWRYTNVNSELFIYQGLKNIA